MAERVSKSRGMTKENLKENRKKKKKKRFLMKKIGLAFSILL